MFTNTALTDDGDVWWEGMDGEPPAHATDWQRQDWTPESDDARRAPELPLLRAGVAVPGHRRRVGGRRRACRSRRSCSAGGAPRPCRSCSSRATGSHGVFVAATMGSEKTAAAFGGLGELRRDPFAMLPFCGYHMGDYFAHWLSMTERTDESKLPAHLRRQLVPQGRGRQRSSGPATARTPACSSGSVAGSRARPTRSTPPIGAVPRAEDLVLDGLDATHEQVAAALARRRRRVARRAADDARALRRVRRPAAGRAPRGARRARARLSTAT